MSKMNIYVPLPTQPKLLPPTPYVCRKVEGYQNLWQPTDDELSPKHSISPHAGMKRLFYFSPPSTEDDEPESPGTCVVCNISNKARHLWLCDEKLRNGKICNATICRWCSTDLRQGAYWKPTKAPDDVKAECLNCHRVVNTRKKLRTDEERAPKVQQMPHEMITTENTMKALQRTYRILDSFIDPMTGTRIPITKGDNRDGSFSFSMINTFLQIDKDGMFAIHKGQKVYEFVKAVAEEDLDVTNWSNLRAYCQAYYANVEKEAIAAGYSPASDDEENNADDEAEDADEITDEIMQEEMQVHDANLSGESDEEMLDVQASDKVDAHEEEFVNDTETESDDDTEVTYVPDNNVLNGPFGGVTSGAV
jgi:hypothetical protein